MNGIELIAQERLEQMTKHGFTLEHDRELDNGQLIGAALYALTTDNIYLPENFSEFEISIEEKHHELIERLKIAGALIAAEIDRLLEVEGNLSHE